MRIFPIGEGVICINGVCADRGERSLRESLYMESYKAFGATGFTKDTHHVSSISLSRFSFSSLPTPYGTQSMDTRLQELPYVPHKSRNEGSPFSLFFSI